MVTVVRQDLVFIMYMVPIYLVLTNGHSTSNTTLADGIEGSQA